MKIQILDKLLLSVLALLMWSAGLWANNTDPFPDVDPYAYYGNMSVTVKVTKGGEALHNAIVAVYCGNEIRGKASPGNTKKPGVAYLTVYGNKSGELLSFKVYDVSEGATYEISETLKYKYNGSKGSPKSPYVVEIGNAGITYGCIKVKQDGTAYEVTIDGNSLDDNTLTSSIGAKKVTYKRTFTSAYATICLPFAVSSADAAAAGRFYQFSGINDRYEVVMTEVTSGLKANTPYIVKPASASTEITFSYSGNVAFPLTGTPETKDGSSASAWSFKGTWTEKSFQGTPAGKTIYFFAAAQQGSVSPGDFVKVNTESTNTKALPFRAYLEYNGSGSLSGPKNAPGRGSSNNDYLPQSMKVIIAGCDGSVTEIGTVSVWNNEIWYNLDGRKLEGKPTENGIYINNGRKVIIKDIY